MLSRILTIAHNTYREAVRARLLLGVFALGLATCVYSMVVATLSLHNEERVVADLGASAVSFYGVLIAIVLGSTSLYRELEHRTIFPILSRPIRRWEYVVGKYLGAVLTVAVFALAEIAVVLFILAGEVGLPSSEVLGLGMGLGAATVAAVLLARRSGVFVFAWCALLSATVAWLVAAPALEERQLVTASAILSLGEVSIVAAVATLFASFSSPFLTAVCTAMIFAIGRSADTLGHLPPKLFGPFVGVGKGFARVLPNLDVYVPSRTLLLGQSAGRPVWPYVGLALAQSVAYSAALLVLSALAFRKRDFS